VRVLEEWVLTPYRLAVHEPTQTAVVADLHLGYSAARRGAGDAVPLPRVETALLPLKQAVERYGFKRLLVAGDLFERRFEADPYQAFVAFLERQHIEWLGLVPGNHDRGVADLAALPIWPDGFRLGEWIVIHGDGAAPTGKRVLGHWHPCVGCRGGKLPCYLVGSEELVLPAYSRDAAGVDVSTDRRWRNYRRFAILGDAVLEEAPKREPETSDDASGS
jgi:putative SbcD/Mre11-related phosphoesterase